MTWYQGCNAGYKCSEIFVSQCETGSIWFWGSLWKNDTKLLCICIMKHNKYCLPEAWILMPVVLFTTLLLTLKTCIRELGKVIMAQNSISLGSYSMDSLLLFLWFASLLNLEFRHINLDGHYQFGLFPANLFLPLMKKIN